MTRRELLLGFASALGLLVGARRARGADEESLLIVVHADNKVDKLGRSTIRDMYLGTVAFWSGDLRVRPFNRAATGEAGKIFYRDVLKMAPSRFRHHWQKRQLSGEGVEPEVVGTAASLVAKIGSTPGGIGYVLASEKGAADARVRLIPIG